MAEEKVRKTTAKKTAVRRTTSKVAPRKTAVRKTAATVTRKAPARESVSAPARGRRSPKSLIVVLFVITLVCGVSAAIGFTDKGAIDVAGKISERKQNASPEEQKALEAVPVQQVQNAAPNGGLVGKGKSAPVPSAPEQNGTTTASTTAETASSTDAAQEEVAADTDDAVTAEEPVPEESTSEGEPTAQ